MGRSTNQSRWPLPHRRGSASPSDKFSDWDRWLVGWACETGPVIREPAEVEVSAEGCVTLPIGLLAEAGINPGEMLLAFSDGDGKIVLRRLNDAATDLLNGSPP